MELQQSVSQAVVFGDIKQNKVRLNVENTDLIISLLSTNLYSNAFESFLRETISNAWDSHVEANVSDPIILSLERDKDSKDFLSISDFGVGLSPERFEEIYLSIGSSTKRGNNSQMGGFGIGRFSALAYSDQVYLTSIYNGTETKYLMYTDNLKIKIDQLSIKETIERNGFTVTVPLKASEDDLRAVLIKQLSYFENLFLMDNRYLTDNNYHSYGKFDTGYYNDIQIKRFKTFSVRSRIPNEYQYGNLKVLIGKVLYEVPADKFSESTVNFPKNTAITFDIGELDLIPNRENILYSEKTKKKLLERYQEFVEEFEQMIKNSSTWKNFTLKQYYQSHELRRRRTLDLQNEIGFSYQVEMRKEDLNWKNIIPNIPIVLTDLKRFDEDLPSRVDIKTLLVRTRPNCSDEEYEKGCGISVKKYGERDLMDFFTRNSNFVIVTKKDLVLKKVRKYLCDFGITIYYKEDLLDAYDVLVQKMIHSKRYTRHIEYDLQGNIVVNVPNRVASALYVALLKEYRTMYESANFLDPATIEDIIKTKKTKSSGENRKVSIKFYEGSNKVSTKSLTLKELLAIKDFCVYGGREDKDELVYYTERVAQGRYHNLTVMILSKTAIKVLDELNYHKLKNLDRFKKSKTHARYINACRLKHIIELDGQYSLYYTEKDYGKKITSVYRRYSEYVQNNISEPPYYSNSTGDMIKEKLKIMLSGSIDFTVIPGLEMRDLRYLTFARLYESSTVRGREIVLKYYRKLKVFPIFKKLKD